MEFSKLRISLSNWLTNNAFILFLCWSFWLAFPYFLFGPLSYVRIHDNGDSNLPLQLSIVYRLVNGELGYWNPQLLSGVDTASGSYITPSAILLLTFLPGWLGYGCLMWLQRFMAGYFTLRLLKDSLQIRTWISIYAGISYALFAQDMVTLHWGGFTIFDGLGLSGLPFYIWALSKINVQQKSQAYFKFIGLGLLFSLTVFYAFAPFILSVLFFWFSLVKPRLDRRFWQFFAIFLISIIIFSLPILVPSFLNSSLSHRYDRSPLVSLNLSQALLKSFFRTLSHISDNIIPLILTVLGLFISRGRDRKLIIVSLGIIFCLIWTFIYPLIALVNYKYIGILSGFDLQRFFIIVPFLIIIGAALGLNNIQTKTEKLQIAITQEKSYRYGITFYSFILILVISLVGWQSLGLQLRIMKEIKNGNVFAAFYQHPDIQQLAATKKDSLPFRVTTIADRTGSLQLHPAYVWSYGLESADGYLTLYPQSYQDYWGQVIAPLTKVDENIDKYFHDWGNRVYLFDSSVQKQSGENSTIYLKDFYDLDLLSLANVKYIISKVPIKDDSLKIFSKRNKDSDQDWQDWNRLKFSDKLSNAFQGKYPGMPLYIYENKNVLPRFFLTHQVQVFDTSSQLLEALGKATNNDLRSTAYLIKDTIPNLSLNTKYPINSQVNLEEYSSDKIKLKVQTNVNSILIITNNYSPYWQALIDNQEKPLFLVNQTFQGVFIPQGNHEVILEYKPPYSLFGSIGLIMLKC